MELEQLLRWAKWIAVFYGAVIAVIALTYPIEWVMVHSKVRLRKKKK
jgi:hypothetical protein